MPAVKPTINFKSTNFASTESQRIISLYSHLYNHLPRKLFPPRPRDDKAKTFSIFHQPQRHDSSILTVKQLKARALQRRDNNYRRENFHICRLESWQTRARRQML